MVQEGWFEETRVHKSRRILVFGATSAIAVAALRIWAQSGCQFCLIARSSDKLMAVSADLKTRGASEVVEIVSELSNLANHQALWQEIHQKFSEFDTVFIAFGTLSHQGQCEREVDLTLSELTINSLAPISLLTTAANYLETRARGDIIVLSSPAGDRGRISNYVYGAAKGGLTVFLSGLRGRLSRSGVNVLTVKPGFVDTPMTRDIKKNFLFASPARIGEGIVSAVEKRKSQVYLPPFWCLIMSIIRLIPEPIFKRLSI